MFNSFSTPTNVFEQLTHNQVNSSLGGTTILGAQSGPKVTLFVISKRNIPDQFKRPHIYKFGEEFLHDMSNNLSRAIGGGGYNHTDTFMPESLTAASAVLPSTDGLPLKTSIFSDSWTFVLTVDNDQIASPLGIHSPSGNRTIYSGWCSEEPVTRPAFGGGAHIINPNCILSITHSTSMRINASMDMFGGAGQLDVMGDYDYLNGTMMATLADSSMGELYNINPGEVRSNTVANPYGGFVSGAQPISIQGSIEIPSEINSPRYHLGRIIGHMKDTLIQSTNSSYATVNNPIVPTNNNSFGLYAGPDTIQQTFTNMIRTAPTNVTPLGINHKERITIGELERRYHHIELVVAEMPSTSIYDVGSQQSPSRKNVLSNVVSSTMPMLLAQQGLASIQFRYNSYAHQTGSLFASANDSRGIFELFHISTLSPVNNNTMTAKWKTFQHYLERVLFPILIINGGQFDLTCHCSLAGVSLINLNMLDDGQSWEGYHETNNLLGGINTPLIAPRNIYDQNAGQLYGAVEMIGPTGWDAPPVDSGPTSINPSLSLF